MSPQKVEDSLSVIRSDDVTMSGVYLGGLADLSNITDKIEWKMITDEENSTMGHIEKATLKEIADQFGGGGQNMITVIVDHPKDTEVYQYGNYGDSWFSLGNLAGYC